MRSVSVERTIVGLFLDRYRDPCICCVLPTDVPLNSVEASKEEPLIRSYFSDVSEHACTYIIMDSGNLHQHNSYSLTSYLLILSYTTTFY